jgi:LPXTG-site transpeptidase (sortase) family protein
MTYRVRVPAGFVLAAEWLSRMLVYGGALGVAFFAFAQFDAWLYQRAQRGPKPEVRIQENRRVQMPERDETEPRPAPSRTAPVVSTGVERMWSEWTRPDPLALGEIEVPRLGVRAFVREGVDDVTLRRAVGHVPGTALPGSTGNSVLAGHRDSFFAGLRHVERGDTIRVRAKGETVEYVVDFLAVVERDAVSVMRETEGKRITLVTCFPFGYAGPAPRRFVVGARQAP